MSQTLLEIFTDVIFANEVGDRSLILKFSDPDGVRSGKSGWSFGKCQFDTKNNPTALACLRECGFTEDEITGIVNQTIDVVPLDAKLAAHADIIEKYDEAQLKYCLDKAEDFDTNYGIPTADGCAILAGADYCNQYGSEGNGAAAYYKALGRPITVLDVLNFKLKGTTYGKNHPADCKRRYDNLIKIWDEVQK